MEKRIPFGNFIKILESHRLILLGEIHGTKEIPLKVKSIIRGVARKINFVFLEIPKVQQKYVDRYLMTNNEQYLYEIPFFRNPLKEGRDSKENLFLIRNIKNLQSKYPKITIICVDSDKEVDRDYFMYKEIKKYLKGGINIFITGNIHANKEIVRINKRELKPCGYYLKKWLRNDLITVNFAPIRGRFYNLKIRDIQDKKLRRGGIFSSKIKGYDFEYRLRKGSPCSFL